MAQKITLTIEEAKIASAIITAAKSLKGAYGALGAAVVSFIGTHATIEGAKGRYALFRKSDAYKGAGGDIQSACRKAFQRIIDKAFPDRVRKLRGTQNKSTAKGQKEAKPATKTIHILPEWAKDLPALIVAWCEDHPVSAIAALRVAYERDVSTIKRAA